MFRSLGAVSDRFVGGAPGPWPWYFFQTEKKGPGTFFEGPGTFMGRNMRNYYMAAIIIGQCIVFLSKSSYFTNLSHYGTGSCKIISEIAHISKYSEW